MRRLFHDKKYITDNDEPRVPVTQQLVIALGTLLLVFGTTYIGELVAFVAPPPAKPAQTISEKEIPKRTTTAEEVFKNIEIEARSAYVWDVANQRALFNKNADEQHPLASITKLMTALVAYELLDQEAVVDISIEAIEQEGDSGLKNGDHFLLQDISDFTLITSSNDGAFALASTAGALLSSSQNAPETFVDAMNIRAEEIGLAQTYFNNPTGLDLSNAEAGAYGSARDVAFLMEYIITRYPNIVELTRSDSRAIENEAGEEYLAENTNYAVDRIPGLIASKTGYTDLAGGNLVIAFNAGLNRPVIVSVLGSTFEGRFKDTVTLAERARAYINAE